NLWIETEKEALIELLGEVDGLILNDDEARQFTEKHNLIDAADWIRDQGATYCIIKKAEHGAMFVGPEGIFALPGYPTDRVQDPTGAGDSFAGGFLGAAASMDAPMDTAFRHGLAYGTVVASFTIEDFGTGPIAGLSRDAVDSRLEQYLAMTQLPDRS
ncbi:MAG: PfkB family carbohydrate kinase, partial [Planctomycetota bacterium]